MAPGLRSSSSRRFRPPTGCRCCKKVEYALAAITATVRPSDVVARVFEDAVMVLLVETDARGARDALIRIRSRVARQAGNWQVTTYTYPEHEQEIEALPVLAAA
jgi:hypothetical protein